MVRCESNEYGNGNEINVTHAQCGMRGVIWKSRDLAQHTGFAYMLNDVGK